MTARRVRRVAVGRIPLPVDRQSQTLQGILLHIRHVLFTSSLRERMDGWDLEGNPFT